MPGGKPRPWLCLSPPWTANPVAPTGLHLGLCVHLSRVTAGCEWAEPKPEVEFPGTWAGGRHRAARPRAGGRGCQLCEKSVPTPPVLLAGQPRSASGKWHVVHVACACACPVHACVQVQRGPHMWGEPWWRGQGTRPRSPGSQAERERESESEPGSAAWALGWPGCRRESRAWSAASLFLSLSLSSRPSWSLLRLLTLGVPPQRCPHMG